MGLSAGAWALERLAQEQVKRNRVLHAKEIMGSFYETSSVPVTSRVLDIRPYVEERVARYHDRELTEAITESLMVEGDKYGLDPAFLVAVIETESRFKLKARGPAGELGLMQLRPDTARWICALAGIEWKGQQALFDPQYNLRLGAAYLAYLREEFESEGRLYVSAYNMGPWNVKRLVSAGLKPRSYYNRTQANYVDFYADVARRVGHERGLLALQ
jgi:soluble lytic murein transglycosylase